MWKKNRQKTHDIKKKRAFKKKAKIGHEAKAIAFGKWSVLTWSYNQFSHLLAFLIFYPNWTFCKGYRLCVVANFAHFQSSVSFRMLGVLWSGFLPPTIVMCSYNRFLHLFGISNFLRRNDHFAKAIAFGSWPILAIFKMLSLGSFWSTFCTQQLYFAGTIVFRTFFAFFIFDPKWPFCKGYNPCFLANFRHFESALIFRILGVALERSLAHNNSNVLVQSFFASFWHF